MRTAKPTFLLFALCSGAFCWMLSGEPATPANASQIAEQARLEIEQGMFTVAEKRVRAALATLPLTDATAMNLWGELGYTLQAQGKLDEAVVCYGKSIAIGGNLEPPAPESFGLVLQNLGAVLERKNAYGQAGVVYTRARSILAAAGLSGTHAAGAVLRGLAICALREGQPKDAAAAIDQALAVVRKADGADSPDYGGALRDKALIELEAGRYDASLDMGKEAVAIQSRFPAADYERISTLNNLGVASTMLGRMADAQTYFQQSVDLWRKTKGSIPEAAPSALHNLAVNEMEALADIDANCGKHCFERAAAVSALGTIALRSGQTRQANALFNEASAITAEFRGKDSADYAYTLSNLADVQLRLHHYREAAGLKERALAIARARLGKSHPIVASIEAGLGVDLYHLKHYDQAEELLRKAVSTEIESFGEANRQVAEAMHDLAMVISAGKQPERATQYFSSAVRAMEGTAGGASDPRLVTWIREFAAALRKQGRFMEAENEEVHATRLEVENAIRLEKAAHQRNDS
jgi:tetratricopeptide (TPR) repeat protein